MQKLTAFLALFLISIFSTAQKGKNDLQMTAYGKIEKAELEMKECDFDPKAEALILLEEGEMDYIFSSGIEIKKRVRIKILSDKGLDWANVHLSYLSEKGAQDITGLEGQTYNLDESGNIVVTKLEKKLIYEKKLNKKYTEKAFTFPAVKVGSVIEYKYKKTGVGLVDWYFQNSIPVRHSRFVLDFPEEIEVATIPHCSRQYESNEKESGRRVVKSYSMNNVPAFRDEPFIINEDYYRDRLETKIVAWTQGDGRRINRVANWLQVIRYLMEDEDFGVQIKRNIPRTTELDEALKTATAPYDRMKTIFKYVQQNMTWNEYLGIWALDGVRSAWKDKKGTVGEINLILVNLLKDAGLDAHPVLVSTHGNGMVNTMDAGTFDWPGFYQFNKVMAFVEMNEQVYVLDASDKTAPVHLIPRDVLMTEGLVIEKVETFDWGWRTLWNKNSVQADNISIRGNIDETGKLNGEVSIRSSDYARTARQSIAKKGKDKYIEQYITGSNPGMTVEDVTFENLDADSLPLIQTVKFNQALNSSGEYRYFSSNILSGLEKNPFVADSRFSDVFFGCNQSYVIMGNFMLPDGYELEGLPKNIRMIMPDTSISMSRVSQVSANVLMTKTQLEFKRPFYPASQYAEFQEFYKQLFELLNEQYVIRKKK